MAQAARDPWYLDPFRRRRLPQHRDMLTGGRCQGRRGRVARREPLIPEASRFPLVRQALRFQALLAAAVLRDTPVDVPGIGRIKSQPERIRLDG